MKFAYKKKNKKSIKESLYIFNLQIVMNPARYKQWKLIVLKKVISFSFVDNNLRLNKIVRTRHVDRNKIRRKE